MTTELCRISTGTEAGHPAVYMDTDVLHVTVLPEKGADIYRFVHKPTGIDVLWKNPVGLWPPGSPPHDGSGGEPFMENYEGCWQELFPSCNDPTTYNGKPVPFHGEVATLAWTYAVEEESDSRIAVRFSVETKATTFRLERLMRLERGSTRMFLDESVTNIGDAEQHFVWGHHCVAGGQWLEAGSRLDVGATTITTINEIYEPKTARLAPGQREGWPHALGRDGERIDLSVIPGVETHSHDDVYLTDVTDGFASVTNPRLGLTFRLSWDASLFKWIISWQPYGGAEVLPFKALPYAVGIEPWVSSKPLGAAVEAGEAIALQPGEALSTTLVAEIVSQASVDDAPTDQPES